MTPYLDFQERQQSASDKGLTIPSGPEMMRAVAARGDVGQPEESTKRVLVLLE